MNRPNQYNDPRRQQSTDVIGQLKVNLFSIVVTSFLGVICYLAQETRSDIKEILATSTANTIKIENLERQVNHIQDKVYPISQSEPVLSPEETKKNQPVKNDEKPKAILNQQSVFIRPEDTSDEEKKRSRQYI